MIFLSFEASIVFCVVSAITFLYHLWYHFVSHQGLPRSIEWAGVGSSILLRLTTSSNSLLRSRELQLDGYEKYSKHGKSFVLPNIITGHEVILPISCMRWLLEQPDSILSQHEVNKQFLAASHTMLDGEIIGEDHMSNLVRKVLTRDLDQFADAVVDEIECSLDEIWGATPSQWQEIDLYEVMLRIFGRLVNRVLVGLPLCRDEEYLACTTGFAKYIVLTAGLINLFPAGLRFLVSPLVTFYDTRQYKKIAKVISPIVRERASTFGPGSVFGKPDATQGNDYVQWALREAYKSDNPKDRTPEMVTKRLTVLTFAAVQSSAITITNALMDIAASSSSIQIQEELRAEALSIAHQFPTSTSYAEKPLKPSITTIWTRSTLAKMTKTDSILRESSRLWGFVSHGVTKVVMSPQGITLPTGEHIPQGAKVGIASYAPHHDETVYETPYEFEPFRFSSSSLSSRDGQKNSNSNSQDVAANSFVTTSSYYLGFSHGRHACPGRFFASQQLKLLLAHVAMRYDIEPVDVRPENPWLNNTSGPPLGAKLRVRRRGC